MESRKDLFVFNVKAFSWASHLENLDLKDDSIMKHLGMKMKGEEPSNSVYRSSQRSFNSKPAWTKSEAIQGILERLIEMERS